MHYFSFKNRELHCENVPVARAAEKFGTPLYLYSHRTLVEHYDKLHRAFRSIDHLICYSLKANSNPEILRSLARRGAGADIVSGGELFLALKAGICPGKIVFAGVGKTEEEIKSALKAGILLFNLESIEEAGVLNSIAKQMKKKAPVAIRLNPDVGVSSHDYVVTGTKVNKFGLNFRQAEKLLGMLGRLPHLAVMGFHLHIGSQIVSSAPYVEAIKRTVIFVRRMKQRGLAIKMLDIGGGLGIIYNDETPATAAAFASAVMPLLRQTECRVIFEPGRFIVGNAGILVTKVLYRKKTPAKNFIIVDAGMNDLIRPSLYGAYHRIVPVRKTGGRAVKADVVGPVCESGDFLGKDRKLAGVKRDDLLAVMSAGAYGFSMSSNYNARLKPAEAMVINGKMRLVRKRGTLQDLLK